MINSENETGNITTYEDDDNEEYGIEIKGKNVVKLNADKVLVKTPLLTSAQDLAGAINELFQGGSGETSADSDYAKWLSLPEPADNQAVFLIRAVNGYMTAQINTGVIDTSTPEKTVGYSIDWGDGTVNIFTNWRSVASHAYTTSGEYVVTFTNICGDNTVATVTYSQARLIMGKYGNHMYGSLMSQQYLRYVRLAPDTQIGANFFNNCYCLKEIEWDGVISELFQGMFANCRVLNFDNINFKSVSEIPRNCFQGCYSLKKIPVSGYTSIGTYAFNNCYNLTDISSSICESIGDGAFQNCYGLRNVKVNNCVSVGNSAFGWNYSLSTVSLENCTTIGDDVFCYCYSLANLTLAKDCTFGEDCFESCYCLYPKPDSSI